VCDRELEIEKFVPREYWSLVAKLATPRGEEFEARLVGADGQKITRLDVGTGQEAADFKQALEQAAFTVALVDSKPARRNPYPPFTTSTLQQEASRKLGFAPAHTMRVAQRLYEGVDIDGDTVGLITYMRTDGVDMAEEAIGSIRSMIGDEFGKQYVPEAPRRYTAKAKNAQEAHEAIRPTEATRRPKDVAKFLEADQAKLYELIWIRALACQMESAELERTVVDITAKAGARALDLRANGTVVKFDGFLRVYQEGRDDEPEDDESRRLPEMSQGERLAKRQIDSTQHFTEPPPRYSEASLVKRMEELGIGRPSTYASILQVLKDRKYVRIDKRRLVPEDRGRIVVAFLENFFLRYVEYDFTAGLEDQLDRVSNNEMEWRELLREFWRDFTGAVGEIKDLKISQVIDALNEMLGSHIFPPRPDGGDPRQCTMCGTGQLSLKLGKFGAFIGCSNYPECRNTRPLTASAEGGMEPSKKLGDDPESGLEVTLRSGRFGPYVQLGEAKDGEKPKRAGLPKGTEATAVDLEFALKLLSLPREIGKHPEDGQPIVAGIGRFGPYVLHNKTYANVKDREEIFTIGLNRAVTLIAEKIAKGPGRGRFGANAGRQLGDHPQKGGPIVVKKGRYGPYVSHAGVNATLPADVEPEQVTIEKAVELLNARSGKAGAQTGDAPRARRTAPRRAKSATASAPAAAKKPKAAKAAAKKKKAAK
jgi:DNA topoisomerase-1